MLWGQKSKARRSLTRFVAIRSWYGRAKSSGTCFKAIRKVGFKTSPQHYLSWWSLLDLLHDTGSVSRKNQIDHEAETNKRVIQRISFLSFSSLVLIVISLSSTRRDHSRNTLASAKKQKKQKQKTEKRARYHILSVSFVSLTLIFISSSSARRDKSRNTHI